MNLRLLQIDAFADAPYTGNPAAVCLLERPAEAEWMQKVAREMNLSETAFLVPRGDGFGLRWFTPAIEVELCGHATVASAHALWEEGVLAADELARFHTLSGELVARRRGDRVEVDFPARPESPADGAPPELPRALGAEARYVGRNVDDFLVEVETEDEVRRLQPDMAALAALPVRGVMVTARATPGASYDFVSRFFAPGAGVAEDPVTGSAHCCLGPFWGKRLGRTEMVGYQASARGGRVQVRLAGERVFLSGGAVTVLRGELLA